MIECGAAIGAAIIALDEYLKASSAKWRTPVLAAAVGIYLPLDLTTPIFLGGLLTWFVERRLGVVKDDHDARDRVHRKGVLFSAGLITGEALIGIFMAIPIVASGKADVLSLPASLHLGQWAGLVMLATLFDFTRRAMPWTAPKSLTNDEVYAVTAHILPLNGIIGENDVMDANTLPKVRMPNRDGFIPLFPNKH